MLCQDLTGQVLRDEDPPPDGVMGCVTRMDLVVGQTLISSLCPGVSHTAGTGCPCGDSAWVEDGGPGEVRVPREAGAGDGHNQPGDDNLEIMIHKRAFCKGGVCYARI